MQADQGQVVLQGKENNNYVLGKTYFVFYSDDPETGLVC